MTAKILSIATLSAAVISCSGGGPQTGKATVVALDPQHFHAALVLKYPNERLDNDVYVYSPGGPGYESFTEMVDSFNGRGENPTDWQLIKYAGTDYLEQMNGGNNGNVVLLAGNNKLKIGYMANAIEHGYNILADKPLIIDHEDFPALEKVFATAAEKQLLVYDIMTERYDILHKLQKIMMSDSSLFGQLLTGTCDDPAVSVTSIHTFYKEVAGKPLKRPAGYYDVSRQGEGIVDVTTHLIDLAMWKCFPGRAIDYRTDVEVTGASSYPTVISPADFTLSTGEEEFPPYLTPFIKDGKLEVNANGSIDYVIDGINTRIDVQWKFRNPDAGGDISRTIIKGSRATLLLLQDAGQDYVPTLYIAPADNIAEEELPHAVENFIAGQSDIFPGLKAVPENGMLKINVPVELRHGHEAHFASVLDKFLDYYYGEPVPQWEISNTIAKYYITTRALEITKSRK